MITTNCMTKKISILGVTNTPEKDIAMYTTRKRFLGRSHLSIWNFSLDLSRSSCSQVFHKIVVLESLKETLAQVYFCKFCEIFKNSISTEHLRTTASVIERTY